MHANAQPTGPVTSSSSPSSSSGSPKTAPRPLPRAAGGERQPAAATRPGPGHGTGPEEPIGVRTATARVAGSPRRPGPRSPTCATHGAGAPPPPPPPGRPQRPRAAGPRLPLRKPSSTQARAPQDPAGLLLLSRPPSLPGGSAEPTRVSRSPPPRGADPGALLTPHPCSLQGKRGGAGRTAATEHRLGSEPRNTPHTHTPDPGPTPSCETRVRRRREGRAAGENPSLPLSLGGARPAAASCRGSAGCNRGKGGIRAAPLQLHTPDWTGPATTRTPRPPVCSPRTPPYPDAAPQDLARPLSPGPGPRPVPAAGEPRLPPPSARFQIEIPWLGPSERRARRPRPLAAEAPPAPPPGAPRARKPPQAGHAPGFQATPPRHRGKVRGGGPGSQAFPRGWRGWHGSVPGTVRRERASPSQPLEVMTATACVRGVLP
ncbi:basic proline-rich protein-like [Dipodomys merriami]|uniref:basic proline-rich protein-like n=1 Tax=Dipodomys merriami TaxID=94247 RepID=UPI003855D182